jgi:hypothetical protein
MGHCCPAALNPCGREVGQHGSATFYTLEGATKTGLMITAAKAATKAAQNPPLDVSNTSQFRDLANSSSRIFGWNTKAGPQTQYNQVVISQE